MGRSGFEAFVQVGCETELREKYRKDEGFGEGKEG